MPQRGVPRVWAGSRGGRGAAAGRRPPDSGGRLMEAGDARSILVVAYRTAATPALIAEVRRRAEEGPSRFTLLVPRPFWDPDTEEAALILELAIPLLEE